MDSSWTETDPVDAATDVADVADDDVVDVESNTSQTRKEKSSWRFLSKKKK